MTEETNNATDNRLCYRSPEVRKVFLKARAVLCQSGNKPMREYDYGDGGFGEV